MKIARLFLVLAVALFVAAGCTSERGPVSVREVEANKTSSLQYAYSLYDMINVSPKGLLFPAGEASSLDDVYATLGNRAAGHHWTVVQRYRYGGALLVESLRTEDIKWLRLSIVKNLRADGWRWVRGVRGPDGKWSMLQREQGVTRVNEPTVVMLHVTTSSQDPSRKFVYFAVGPADQKDRVVYDMEKVIQVTSSF